MTSEAVCRLLPAAEAAALIRPVAIAMGGGGLPDHLRAVPNKPASLNGVSFHTCLYKSRDGGQWLETGWSSGLPPVSSETTRDPSDPRSFQRFVINGHVAVYTAGAQGSGADLDVQLPGKVVLTVLPRFGTNTENPGEARPELEPLAQEIATAILARPTPRASVAAVSATTAAAQSTGQPRARGNHVLRSPVHLCAITAIAAYVASMYHVTDAPVRCAPPDVKVAGEAPDIASENWYFPTIVASGDVGTGDGRVSIDIVADHTQYTPHYWQDQLGFLKTAPKTVHSAKKVNGVPALWVSGYELITPYGTKEDLEITVFADLDGRQLPEAERDAKKLATLVEMTAFQ